MSTTQAPAGEISGKVMFYETPEPLSIELHGNLGLAPSETPFGFAATANAVPLQVTEFGPASLSYPVIFAGESYQPLAVMSIRPDENLFVTPEGRFDPTAYVPAFIRRYPFVLANDDTQQRLVVCIDRKASMLVENGPVPLFENGEATEYTKNCIQFCQEFENERVRTESFVQLLRDLDLFETKQATYTPVDERGVQGAPAQIAEYFAISDAKLRELPADKLVELRDSGALQQIYAHITSLLQWERLVAKTLVKFNVAGNA